MTTDLFSPLSAQLCDCSFFLHMGERIDEWRVGWILRWAWRGVVKGAWPLTHFFLWFLFHDSLYS